MLFNCPFLRETEKAFGHSRPWTVAVPSVRHGAQRPWDEVSRPRRVGLWRAHPTLRLQRGKLGKGPQAKKPLCEQKPNLIMHHDRPSVKSCSAKQSSACCPLAPAERAMERVLCSVYCPHRPRNEYHLPR